VLKKDILKNVQIPGINVWHVFLFNFDLLTNIQVGERVLACLPSPFALSRECKSDKENEIKKKAVGVV
jgi:hypothetical protein